MFRQSRLARVLAVAAALFAGASQQVSAQDKIVWGKPSEVISFDPHISGDGTSWTFFYMVYETLMGTDDALNVAPRLAERWEQPSPTTYIFHLRPTAAFSNGRPLTADDVVGSLMRLRSPELGAAWGRLLGDVKEIVADGPHTVRIELNAPHTPLLSILSVSTTSILPMQELEDGSFDPTTQLLGSGPYMVMEHLQDQSWTLAANPHYGVEGLPRTPGFEIQIIPDDAARIAALRTGRVHVATFENPDTTRLLAGVANVETVVQRTPNFFRLDVSGVDERSAFRDLRVRQAMSLALDRERMVEFVFGGDSQPDFPVPAAFDSPACRSLPSYVMPRAERLEKARALLAEAGTPNPEVGLIASPVLVTYPLIAQVMQGSLAEAGFRVTIEQVPVPEWYARVFAAETDFDFAVSWFAGYSDPSLVMRWWDSDASGWNRGFIEPVAEYVEVMKDVFQLPPGDARDAAMTRACEIIDENANMLALVNKPDYIGVRADLIDARFDAAEGNFNTLKHVAEFTLR